MAVIAYTDINTHLADFALRYIEPEADPNAQTILPDINISLCQRSVKDFARQCLPLYIYNDEPPEHEEWYRLATADPRDPIFCDKQGHRTRIGAAIAAPRGHAKSTVVSFVSVLWQALTGRKQFILIISDVQEQAVLLVDAIRRELEENELIKVAFPGLRIGCDMRPELKWTSSDLIITIYDDEGKKIRHQTRIIAKGTNSRIRGMKFRHRRPDLIIGDDLENDELVSTPEQRKKTWDWFTKAIIPSLDPEKGQLLVVGTILHYASLLSRLLQEAPDDQVGADGMDLGAVLVQRRYKAIINYNQPEAVPMWPARFTMDILMTTRKTIGSLAFMQEFQNEPIDEQTRTVQPSWVQWWATGDVIYDQHYRRWLFRGKPMLIYIGVDPAIEEDKDADWFALVVIGVTADKEIVTLDVKRTRLGLADQVSLIDQQIGHWKPAAVMVEAVQAQAWLAQEVIRRGRWLAKIKPIKSMTNKYKRIRATAPWWENGQVYVRKAVNGEGGQIDETKQHLVHHLQWAFYEEVITFPHGKHDDIFDAWHIATKGAGSGSGTKATRVA